MTISRDCGSVEEAREMFPELKDAIVTEIQCKDKLLFLFTNEPIDDSDIEIFKRFTSKEIEFIFFDIEKTRRLVSHYETENSELH